MRAAKKESKLQEQDKQNKNCGVQKKKQVKIQESEFQERDAGIYECQIPTQPPQSYPINLNIIGPSIIIIIKIRTQNNTKIVHNLKTWQEKVLNIQTFGFQL